MPGTIFGYHDYKWKMDLTQRFPDSIRNQAQHNTCEFGLVTWFNNNRNVHENYKITFSMQSKLNNPEIYSWCITLIYQAQGISKDRSNKVVSSHHQIKFTCHIQCSIFD